MYQQACRMAVLVFLRAGMLFGLVALQGCNSTARFDQAINSQQLLATLADAECLQSFDLHQEKLQQDSSFSYPLKISPALRINRSLMHRPLSELAPTEQLAWLAESHALALETAQTLGLAVTPCDQAVWKQALGSANFLQSISRDVVPSEYSDWMRVVGIYPVTRIPFVAGVKKELTHQVQVQSAYAAIAEAGEYMTSAHWRFYQPSLQAALKPNQVFSGHQVDVDAAMALLAFWAPAYAVERGHGGANTVGRPVRNAGGRLIFDAESQPAVYRYISWGEFAGEPVLQLNYQVWFSERPSKSKWDVLAGRLDGLHWRVHLGRDGKPMAFDAMHSCGCWYHVYPAQGFHIKTEVDYWQEPFFVGKALNLTSRPLLMLSADEHALVGVRTHVLIEDADELTPVDVSWAALGVSRELDSTALGYRRNFDRRGIIPESVRAERFYFWPMGIPSAGSMRAPGHHAIAFTGRRHFDDPTLLDALGLERSAVEPN